MLEAALDAEIGPKPGEEQHRHPAADHDPEREERDEHRRPVLRRKIGQADFLRREAHAGDQAAQDRNADGEAVRLGRGIGDGDQHLARRLLVAPAPFDRREFRGLIVMDEVAGEMTEKELRRNEDGREIEAHAQHDSRFGLEVAPQEIPRARRGDAKGARQIRGEEHVRKADPDDRAENDLAPIDGDESAVLDGVADRRLHPAVVDHDPERGECGAQRDHRGREQIEPRRDSLPAEQKDAEEACLERKGREGLIGEKRPLYRPGYTRELAPVRAELERHHDAGDDAEPEGDAENLEPELEDDAIRRPPGREMQRLENGQPRRQSDRERWKDDVERDGEGELQPRQQQC